MTKDTNPDPVVAEGGEPAFGTGTGGSRFGNASLSSAAGTASLRERPTDAGDGVDETEYFVVTDSGQHLAVHVDGSGHASVDPPPEVGGP